MKKNFYIKNFILNNQNLFNERFLKNLKVRGIYANVNPLLFLKNMKELRIFLNLSYTQKIKKFDEIKSNLKIFAIKRLTNLLEKKQEKEKELIKFDNSIETFYFGLQKITFNIINRYYPNKFDFSQMSDIVMTTLHQMLTEFNIDITNFNMIEKIYYNWINPKDKSKKIPNKINLILEKSGLLPEKKSNRWYYLNQWSFDDTEKKEQIFKNENLSYYSQEYLEEEIDPELQKFVIDRKKGLNSRNCKEFGYSYRKYRSQRDLFKKWEAENYLHSN